jgi:hypothetical protein
MPFSEATIQGYIFEMRALGRLNEEIVRVKKLLAEASNMKPEDKREHERHVGNLTQMFRALLGERDRVLAEEASKKSVQEVSNHNGRRT